MARLYTFQLKSQHNGSRELSDVGVGVWGWSFTDTLNPQVRISNQYVLVDPPSINDFTLFTSFFFLIIMTSAVSRTEQRTQILKPYSKECSWSWVSDGRSKPILNYLSFTPPFCKTLFTQGGGCRGIWHPWALCLPSTATRIKGPGP